MGSRGGSPSTAKASPHSGGPGGGGGGGGGALPSSNSEWLCYTLLEHANLLGYYHVFIAQGGDDVPQLMEAGEEEFLEIMALVGMAQKPLHVRRLQKALQEYSLNPTRFNLMAMQKQAQHQISGLFPPPGLATSLASQLLPSSSAGPSGAFLSPAGSHVSLPLPTQLPSPQYSTPIAEIQINRGGAAAAIHRRHDAPKGAASSRASPRAVPPRTLQPSPTPLLPPSSAAIGVLPPTSGSSSSLASTPGAVPPSTSALPKAPAAAPPTTTSAPTSNGGGEGSSAKASGGRARSESRTPSGTEERLQEAPSDGGGDGGGTSDFEFGSEGSIGPNPGLSDEQVGKLAVCAAALITSVPDFQPKLVQNKKKISPALLNVMQMPAAGPQAALRLEEFRRYSAIYGRFDAKRKPDKPLTLHEVSVNEAAAQIALLRPALLTRRDELFPLARQVVKDAGYNYSKPLKRPDYDDDSGPPRKRSAESATSSRSQSPASPVSTTSPAPRPLGPPPSSTALLFPAASSSLQQLQLAAVIMQGSPSSSGMSGTSSGLGGVGQTAALFRRYQHLSAHDAAERLAAAKAQLAKVLQLQSATQEAALGLNDIGALAATSAELKGLSQRQVELLNEQAALELVLRESSEASQPRGPGAGPAVTSASSAAPAAESTSEAKAEPHSDDESGDVEVGHPALPPQTTPPPGEGGAGSGPSSAHSSPSDSTHRVTRLASKRERQ